MTFPVIVNVATHNHNLEFFFMCLWFDGKCRDESEWWMLPCGLVLCKIIQARLIDCHVANQEIQDFSLYSSDPDVFWQS
jgi:hypothetical protein